MPEPTDTRYVTLEVIPPAGVEYDPRMAVPHVIGDVEHPAHPGDPCFNVALIAPEPGADAALRDQLRLVRDLAGHRSRDIDHDCFAMNCRTLGDEVERLRAALARPTPALDVEALAEALHKLYPALRGILVQNPKPCDHEPVYGSLTEGGPSRTECEYDADELAAEYTAILAARATEGGTDR